MQWLDGSVNDSTNELTFRSTDTSINQSVKQDYLPTHWIISGSHHNPFYLVLSSTNLLLTVVTSVLGGFVQMTYTVTKMWYCWWTGLFYLTSNSAFTVPVNINAECISKVGDIQLPSAARKSFTHVWHQRWSHTLQKLFYSIVFSRRTNSRYKGNKRS